MLKKLGKLFYPSQPHHESGAATGFYLCGSAYRFTLCGNAHAHVSKYGGEFLNEKNVTFLKKAKVKAFTLVEMLVVLLIISVLLLLFVPNLTKQKEAVNDKGKAAVVKVVGSQAELYSLDKNEDASPK